MLAFCFLTYRDVEHREIWEPFFAGAGQAMVVIHRKEGTGSWLHEVGVPGLTTTVIPTQPTEWGTWSLVEVQQSLFRAAVANPAVTKCILLSADTVPLYSFAELYSRLMADDKGYIGHIPNKRSNRKHPNQAAWSGAPFRWSLTPQWVILNRSHVAALEAKFSMLRAVFGAMYIPDEHVYIIFFDSFGLLGSFHLTAPIHVQWDQTHRTIHTMMCAPLLHAQRRPTPRIACAERHRDRPHTFHAVELTAAKLDAIYASGAFFLRKVCRLATLRRNPAGERLLLPSEPCG